MEISELYNIFKQSTGICTDTRKIKEKSLFFALKGPNFNANKMAQEALGKGAIRVLIDDEVYFQEGCILVEDALETLQKLANFHRQQFNIPVLGITGTNGKTTTKELIAAVLQAKFKIHCTKGNLNNHIGVPLTLLEMPMDTEIAIIEMGANHIGEIAKLCDIAEPNLGMITNIGKAHLEGFGSFEGVAKAKSELYYHILKHRGGIFVNSEDEHLSRMAQRFETPIKYPQKEDFCNCELKSSNPFLNIKYDSKNIQTNLIGTYNFSNVAAAICIGKYFKIDAKNIQIALENYESSNNRSQVVKKGTNTIILDAYNANPSSMGAAIESFKHIKSDNRVLILGDMFELGTDSIEEHENIGKLTNVSFFNQVFLVGKGMIYAAQENKESIHFEDKNELIEYLEKMPIENGYILIKGSRGMALESIVEHI